MYIIYRHNALIYKQKKKSVDYFCLSWSDYIELDEAKTRLLF